MLLVKRKGSFLGKFKIFETESFLEDLEKNFSVHQERIKNKLLHFVYPQLRQNPYFGKNIKKLVNYKPETWRYRVGEYRFFYTIHAEEKLVLILTVDHRQSAY
jgi:mRNA interferase RelE/StbE